MTIFFDIKSVSLEFPPIQSMYKPGELMNAVVDGRNTVVYLTMDSVSLNDEGDPIPRFREYPGHEMIDAESDVMITGTPQRFAKIPSGLLKN